MKKKQQNDYSNMLAFIFRIEQENEYSDEVIQEYEDNFKIDVLEALADYCDEEASSDEDPRELEDSILMYYNPNNLVDWFKK